jgi:transglutaminase-like putative cysteine protease
MAGCGSLSETVSKTVSKIEDKPVATADAPKDEPDRDNTPKVLVWKEGEQTFSGQGATVDYSDAGNGYITAKYEGDNQKVKLQIAYADEDPYTYDILPNTDFMGFPLTRGSGSYTIGVFLNVSGNKYSQAVKQAIDVTIDDEFAPYLRPNQYSDYTEQSELVKKCVDIINGVKTDNQATESVFLYITSHVTYDHEKADTVQSGYIPDPDETLATGKGICFDYASLMTSMLRSQGIPCELIVGYAGKAYHSWIAVYAKESGEIANIIEFKDGRWNLMDPTFVASGDDSDPNKIGDGTTYNPVYYY